MATFLDRLFKREKTPKTFNIAYSILQATLTLRADLNNAQIIFNAHRGLPSFKHDLHQETMNITEGCLQQNKTLVTQAVETIALEMLLNHGVNHFRPTASMRMNLLTDAHNQAMKHAAAYGDAVETALDSNTLLWKFGSIYKKERSARRTHDGFHHVVLLCAMTEAENCLTLANSQITIETINVARAGTREIAGNIIPLIKAAHIATSETEANIAIWSTQEKSKSGTDHDLIEATSALANRLATTTRATLEICKAISDAKDRRLTKIHTPSLVNDDLLQDAKKLMTEIGFPR